MALTAAPGPRRTAPADTSRQAKARYYFLHAANLYDQQKLVEAYELYRKAYATDPDNDAVAFNYAIFTWLTTEDTIVEKECMAIMRRYVDMYPGDLQSARMYANLQMNRTRDYLEAARVYNNILRANPNISSTYIDLWRAYSNASLPDSALWALDRYEQAEGASEQSTFTKIMTLLETGDTTAMINTARGYVNSKPLDPDALVLLGSIYDAFGMQDSAMLVMQKAIDLAPTASRPKSELAKLCLAHKDTVRADSLMALTMLSTDLTTADKAAVLNDFLETLVHYQGDLHRALPLVDALLSDDPENEDAWGVKLRVHWTLNEWPEAMTAASRLTALNPANEENWVSALTVIANGKLFAELDSTYADMRQHISTPSFPSKLMYTVALNIAGRYREALDYSLGQIRQILPDYTLPPRRKPGDPFPALHTTDVIEVVDTALVVDSVMVDEIDVETVPEEYAPGDTVVVVDPADFAECFAIPDSVSREANRLSDWLQMAADQYVALGDTAQGLALYDQSLCMNPNNTLVLNNYAYFLALRGHDLDRAAEMSYAAVSSDPSATNLDTYAYVLFRKRDYKGAQRAMDLIFNDEKLSSGDLSHEIYEHYGDIMFMVGDPATALTYWKKALELDPDNELLQRKVKHETFFYK